MLGLIHKLQKSTIKLNNMTGDNMDKNMDYAALREEMLALHKASIDAHLEKNIPFFTQDVSDKFVSVSRGEINKPSKEETTAMFTSYLENTEFSEYRDVQEPIIGFSKDGSIAWSIVQVKVSGKQKINEEEANLDYISSWIMLYERQGNKWVKLVNASSFKP